MNAVEKRTNLQLVMRLEATQKMHEQRHLSKRMALETISLCENLSGGDEKV